MWRSPLVEGYNLQRLSKTFPSRHKGFLGVLYRRVSQVKRWQLNFPRACVLCVDTTLFKRGRGSPYDVLVVFLITALYVVQFHFQFMA